MEAAEAELLFDQIRDKEQEARRVDAELRRVNESIRSKQQKKQALLADIHKLHREETRLAQRSAANAGQYHALADRDAALSGRIDKLRAFEERFSKLKNEHDAAAAAAEEEELQNYFAKKTTHGTECRVGAAVMGAFNFLGDADDDGSDDSIINKKKQVTKAFYRSLGSLGGSA